MTEEMGHEKGQDHYSLENEGELQHRSRIQIESRGYHCTDVVQAKAPLYDGAGSPLENRRARTLKTVRQIAELRS